MDLAVFLPRLVLPQTIAILSFLFLLGVVVLLFAPETKGQELPE